MKKTFINLALVLMCGLAIAACDNKKSGRVVIDDGGDGTEEVLADDEDPEPFVDDGSGVDSEYENELWTALGGTYIFYGDGETASVEFPLHDEEGHIIMRYGDDELWCDLDDEGHITAYDTFDKVVFEGGIYAGGNLLKGKYNGKEIYMWGPGD